MIAKGFILGGIGQENISPLRTLDKSSWASQSRRIGFADIRLILVLPVYLRLMVFETVPNRRLCLLRSAGMEDVNLVEEFIPRIGKAACGGSLCPYRDCILYAEEPGAAVLRSREDQA